MKALAIVALVFSSIALFVPVIGLFMAMLTSVLAIIAFRSQPTLCGVTFGINIIGTAFLSPSLFLAETGMAGEAGYSEGELYGFYVGWHLAALAIAIVWRLVRGPAHQTATAAPTTPGNEA